MTVKELYLTLKKIYADGGGQYRVTLDAFDGMENHVERDLDGVQIFNNLKEVSIYNED